MTRKKYIVGNWKMNQSLPVINTFFNLMSEFYSQINCEAWIAPQNMHLSYLIGKSKSINGKIKIGAQNCHNENTGAFTGENSPEGLEELGCHFTLVGHSERRAYFHEDNDFLNKKVHSALKNHLTVIYCCGETLEQREANETMDVVSSQIKEGLKDLTATQLENVVIAYEPVWAIGTGVTATPDQAQEVHSQIRSLMKELYSSEGESTPILYGGSVKPNNIKELLGMSDIDGGLVGGASLKAEDFSALCLSASSI